MASNENTERIYDLSDIADSDLGDIYDFSFKKYGFVQAEEYLEGIHQIFKQLTFFSEEGVLREEITENLRSIPYQSHIVFYSVYKKSILIVRILHKAKMSLIISGSRKKKSQTPLLL